MIKKMEDIIIEKFGLFKNFAMNPKQLLHLQVKTIFDFDKLVYIKLAFMLQSYQSGLCPNRDKVTHC